MTKDKKTIIITSVMLGVSALLLFGLMTLCLYGLLRVRLGNRCFDPAIRRLLKNDDTTPECVIDGDYYCLPCKLKVFADRGWVFDSSNSGVETDWIEPGAVCAAVGEHLIVWAVNVTDTEQDLMNLRVVQISYTVKKESADRKKNYFVTKYGITEETSYRTVNRLYKDTENYVRARFSAWASVPDPSALYSPDRSSEILKIRYYYNENSQVMVSCITETQLTRYQNAYRKQSGNFDFCVSMRKEE